MKQIIRTQECIKELFGNQDLFIALEATLTKFHSVDKLMKFAVVSRKCYPFCEWIVIRFSLNTG